MSDMVTKVAKVKKIMRGLKATSSVVIFLLSAGLGFLIGELTTPKKEAKAEQTQPQIEMTAETQEMELGM